MHTVDPTIMQDHQASGEMPARRWGPSSQRAANPMPHPSKPNRIKLERSIWSLYRTIGDLETCAHAIRVASPVSERKTGLSATTSATQSHPLQISTRND